MTGDLIDTARLRLRGLRSEDEGALWAIWSEEPVRRFLITVPRGPEDFAAMFRTMMAQSASGHLWAIEDRTAARLLGRCGFYVWDEEHPPEFAILLTEESWGRGLASEAAQACLAFAFEQRRWPTVTAVARPGNRAIRRVLERAGFRGVGEDEIHGAPALWFSATARADD